MPKSRQPIVNETQEDSSDAESHVKSLSRPVAVFNHSIEPPVLKNGTKESIASFETAYLAYERKLQNLAAQGVDATPVSVASCIPSATLKLICRVGLNLNSDGWMSVTDDVLRPFLFGQAAKATTKYRRRSNVCVLR